MKSVTRQVIGNSLRTKFVEAAGRPVIRSGDQRLTLNDTVDEPVNTYCRSRRSS